MLETNNDDDSDVGPRMHLDPPELPPHPTTAAAAAASPPDETMAEEETVVPQAQAVAVVPLAIAPPPQTNDNANNDKKKGRSAMLALVDMLELPPSCRSFANYLSNTTVPVPVLPPTTVLVLLIAHVSLPFQKNAVPNPLLPNKQ